MFRQSTNNIARISNGTSLIAVFTLLAVLPAHGRQKHKATTEKRTPIVGRVLAWKESLVFGAGVGPKWTIFVFGIESPNQSEKQPQPVKIAYGFYKDQGPLPDNFYDYSKRYELQVVRNPKCDESLSSLSREKSVDETGKELAPTDVLRFLYGAPKYLPNPDTILPCYVLRPGKYRLLNNSNRSSLDVGPLKVCVPTASMMR